MDIILGGLAFFALIVAQLATVVAVHNTPWEGESREPQDRADEARPRYRLNFGG